MGFGAVGRVFLPTMKSSDKVYVTKDDNVVKLDGQEQLTAGAWF